MRLHLKYNNGSWKNETATTTDSGFDMDVTTPSRDVSQHLTQDETTEERTIRQPEVQMRKLTKHRPVSRLRNRPEFVASLNRTMPSLPSDSTTPKKGLNTSMKRRENHSRSPGPAAKKRILTEDVLEERSLIEQPEESCELSDSACDLNQTAPVYQQQPARMTRPTVQFSPSPWYHVYPPSPYVFYGGYPYQQNYMYRAPPIPHPTAPSAYLQAPPTYLHYHQPSAVRYNSPASEMPSPLQTPFKR